MEHKFQKGDIVIYRSVWDLYMTEGKEHIVDEVIVEDSSVILLIQNNLYTYTRYSSHHFKLSRKSKIQRLLND
jgi:hypothetical protein